MERLKRKSSERLSDETEKHDQNMLDLGRYDVEKLRFTDTGDGFFHFGGWPAATHIYQKSLFFTDTPF